MPKIALFLEHYHLDAIPEAHCYLTYKNNTLDVTFPYASEFSFNTDLEQKINITPQQIGSFKVTKHQTFIRAWIKDNPNLSFDFIWAAREQWIQKLGQ